MSLDSQNEELDNRFPDLEVVHTFIESKSAYKPYIRTEFDTMMNNIEKGEVQGIQAWHPDRLSRNPIDSARIMYALDQGTLMDLKFATYHFDNSPEGKMLLAYILSQSKYSSEKLGVDVMRGLVKKCQMGCFPGRAPLGYKNEKRGEKGKKRILKDEVNFDLCRKMWDMILMRIYSVQEIREIAVNEWNLVSNPNRPLSQLAVSTLYNIFTNPFYYGVFEWNGDFYKGSYDPMVTKEEFDIVQKYLGNKGKPRRTKHESAFTNCIRCKTCGCSITADIKSKHLKKTNSITTYVYYKCTNKSHIDCNERAIEVKDLEQQIVSILDQITIPERFRDYSITYLNNINQKEKNEKEKIRLILERELHSINKRVGNLVDAYISEGNKDKLILTEMEFMVQKKNLLGEQESVKQKLNDLDNHVKKWHEAIVNTFNFATQAKETFEKGTLKEKRYIFQVIGQNFLLSDGKLSAELKTPFLMLKKGLEDMRSEKSRIELTANVLRSTKKGLSQHEIPIWSPVVAAIRTFFLQPDSELELYSSLHIG